MTIAGAVRCWGIQDNGRSTPPDDLGSIVQVSAGENHTCTVDDKAHIRCWGYNGAGQTTVPFELAEEL